MDAAAADRAADAGLGRGQLAHQEVATAAAQHVAAAQNEAAVTWQQDGEEAAKGQLGPCE